MTAVLGDPKRPRETVTTGGCLMTVTADPGCQPLLAAAVRYSRALAWSLAKVPLAIRKLLTICCGSQPGCGARMIRPQQPWPPPAPLPGPGGPAAGCTTPLSGIAAQPATRATASAPATAHGIRSGARAPSRTSATRTRTRPGLGPHLGRRPHGSPGPPRGRRPHGSPGRQSSPSPQIGRRPHSRPVPGRWDRYAAGVWTGKAGLGLGLVGAERQRRPSQFLAGRARHGQPENRAPAAMQAGILERDGQPQPRSAGRARPRRVGTPEPVEHHLRLGGPEADAVIPYRYRHRVAVAGHGDHHVAPLAVLDG